MREKRAKYYIQKLGVWLTQKEGYMQLDQCALSFYGNCGVWAEWMGRQKSYHAIILSSNAMGLLRGFAICFSFFDCVCGNLQPHI